MRLQWKLDEGDGPKVQDKPLIVETRLSRQIANIAAFVIVYGGVAWVLLKLIA